MKTPNPAATFWFLVSVVISALYYRRCFEPRELQEITFDTKTFSDSAQTTGDGFVYIAGTLTGDGVLYKNNTVAISCYKDRMECMTSSVEQIGPSQIGRLDWPIIYPIVRWDPYEVVATGPGDAMNCRKVTISIVRKSQSAVWVEEPINQSSAACKEAETKIRKWTIEDSVGWNVRSGRRQR